MRNFGHIVSFSLALLLCAWRFAGSEPPPSDPSKWLPLPGLSDDTELCANWGFGGSWQVSASDGAVAVAPRDMHTESTKSLDLAGGKLVALDQGEFGGNVRWVPEDGDAPQVVFEGNPLGFATLGDELVVIEGLAHLSLNGGTIRHLARAGESAPWKVTRTIDLGAAPQAYTIDDAGNLLVLTTKHLTEYSDGTLRVLANTEDLGLLYSDSLVSLPNGRVYAGMRYVVVRFDRTARGYSRQLFVPPSCPVLERVEGQHKCVCRS